MENNSESTNPTRKTYSCQICNRTFIRLHRLQSHIRTHRKKNAIIAATLPRKANPEALKSPKYSKSIKVAPVTEVTKIIGTALAHNNSLQFKKISLLSNSVDTEFPQNVTERDIDNDSSSSAQKSFNSLQKSSNSPQKSSNSPQKQIRLQKRRPSILSKTYVSLQNPFNGTEEAVFETAPVADSLQDVTQTMSTSIEQLQPIPEDLHESTDPSLVGVEPLQIPTDPDADLVGEIVIKTEVDEDDTTNEQDVKNTPRSKVLYACDMCEMTFGNKSHLGRHKLSHTKEKPHICKICNRGFTQIGNLNVHIRNHSAQKPPEPKPDPSQQGVVANLQTSQVTPYPVFKKVCLTTRVSRPHTCEICGKKFENKCYYDRHTLTHTKEKPHVCTVCFKGFAQVGNLNVHYLTHTNLKTFICHVCDKGFTLMGSLKAHLHTHSEHKPYQCEVCGKGFANKCFLKRHFLTHTEVKPYVCKVCQKGFVQVGNLNVHMLTHAKDKVFKCEVCGKAFSRKLYMQKHYKQHIVTAAAYSSEQYRTSPAVEFLLEDRNCRQECVSGLTDNNSEKSCSGIPAVEFLLEDKNCRQECVSGFTDINSEKSCSDIGNCSIIFT